MNHLNGPLADHAAPSPLRGHAPVAIDLDELTSRWGHGYEILTSLSGDRWVAWRRGESIAPWIVAGSATGLDRRLQGDDSGRTLRTAAPEHARPSRWRWGR